MGMFRLYVLLLVTCFIGCRRSQPAHQVLIESMSAHADSLPSMANSDMAGRGALLLSKFNSFEELQAVIRIEYFEPSAIKSPVMPGQYMVRLTHRSGGREVTSILKTGVDQEDFLRAQSGGFWDRVSLALQSPYSLFNRDDLRRVYTLARWRSTIFGESDVAFFDLAQMMTCHISAYDAERMPSKYLSEKGYLNTFNHITAQALITTLFSEKMADFVSDAHERFHTPELITGEFTQEQIADIENGPTDNYIDIINNEWGQELGKELKNKYNINRKTIWTPELLEDYLNDIQSYYSWAFQISFDPIQASDEVVIKYSNKLRRVMEEAPSVK